MSVPATRCARCVAGQCGHVMCKPGGSYQHRITDVAGTSCCADCAPVLLEAALHPVVHGIRIITDDRVPSGAALLASGGQVQAFAIPGGADAARTA